MVTVITNVNITPLRRIVHPKGDVFHALKRSEDSFKGFGEAYFTSIIQDEVKGWKKHTEMVMNLVVPQGDVEFYFFNENTDQKNSVRVNADNYVRITVLPGVWVAFKGVGSSTNLILNLASLEHNPDEAVNVPLKTFTFGD